VIVRESEADGDPSLESLLISQREALARIVRRQGGGLLRYESVEDLVQGVHMHALRVEERFEYRGEKEFLGWLARIAKQHIADRHDYWSARKRNAGKLLRITASGGGSSTRTRGVQPAASGPGPATFALRREMFVVATKAISLLLPRDQQIIQWIAEDVSIDETAQRLGVSYDAAERARLRAIERFRKTFRLLSPESGEGRS
jgi:RNA polymerase sigma factor (sigma-70 family)